MYCYMVACAEDGEDENLQNLLSIVGCNRGELHEGGEGSCRWDLEQYDTEKDRQQVIKDSRTIDWIYKVIQKELKAKYVMECSNCGTCYCYQRKPKYTGSDTSDGGEHYICGHCRKENTLNVYTMDSWLTDKKMNLKEITRYM
jgi:hypothetical protein